ncbi:hypothetical protein AB0B94_00715 [Micromonospora sp. NPDC048986]|uniref:competence protein CoiA family protein n=1 Tax=Micromonospora sp. NPDC048986 TaxID=3155644 RepID=UPI0033F1BE60
MPLLAMVDGVRTVSTLLSDEQWQSLRTDVRAGRCSVRLPYCGVVAYLRTSKLGVRHFAHRAASDCASHSAETGQHLYAKNIIVQAARAAGWDAEPEARGEGWVADVLATGGMSKFAFEVQWSAQTRDQFEHRQHRYAADRVHGVWFTRYERSVPLPRRDLPVFHTAFAADSVTTVVNGTAMPLADAVIGLLTGRIGFRTHVATGQPAITQVSCFEYPCYRCSGVSLFWEVEREVIDGPCGTRAEIRHALIWAQDRPEARPDVRRRVAMEAGRLGVPLANLGSRYSATARGSYTAFSCPSCNALFGDWYLREYVMEARAEDAFLLVTFPGGGGRIEQPHWCRDAGQGQCVDREQAAALTGGPDLAPATHRHR